MSTKESRRQAKGLTLIELLITMAVIAVVAAISIPILTNVVGTANSNASDISVQQANSFILEYTKAGSVTYTETDTQHILSGLIDTDDDGILEEIETLAIDKSFDISYLGGAVPALNSFSRSGDGNLLAGTSGDENSTEGTTPVPEAPPATPKWTLSYEYNGADSGNSVQTIDYTEGGDQVVLPSPGQTGKDFTGWTLTSDGSGTRLLGGQSVTANSDRTLYAQWATGKDVLMANMGVGASGIAIRINQVAIQSDGKIVLAGSFSEFNNTKASSILRLNADGTRDTAFSTNIGGGPISGQSLGTIDLLLLQSDGKMYVAGNFSSWNGQGMRGLILLNSDGTRNMEWQRPNFAFTNSSIPEIRSITFDSAGKMLITGTFNRIQGETSDQRGMIRLNTDGTRDTSFIGACTNGYPNNMLPLPDDKILLVGCSSVNSTQTIGLNRLMSDGTLDPSFAPNSRNNVLGQFGNNNVLDAHIQSDGKILYESANRVQYQNISRSLNRVNADGSVDTTFTGSVYRHTSGNDIYKIEEQADGKILVAGNFNLMDGDPAPRIVRLNSDGTRDTTFADGILTGTPNSVAVWDFELLDSGRTIVVGSSSTSVGNPAVTLRGVKVLD